MATQEHKCAKCGKMLDDEELTILSDILAGLNRERIERHNETMTKIGMPLSEMEPPRHLLPMYERCGACYMQEPSRDMVAEVMDQIIDTPWKHPGVFQYEEVES